ncbi:MAG: thioesterase family protein [Burkholderiaceae bacterium]
MSEAQNEGASGASGSGLPATIEDAIALQRSDRLAVFELEIPIRWGDMDAMGHVNNTEFFRYMEQARISWFDAMGVPAAGDDDGPVIINAFCSFLEELRYPGSVRLTLSIGEMGRSSLQTYCDISRVDDPGTIVASGGAKIVWIHVPSRRSIPIPQDLRKRMAEPVKRLPRK